jgi:hypothetical protein
MAAPDFVEDHCEEPDDRGNKADDRGEHADTKTCQGKVRQPSETIGLLLAYPVQSARPLTRSLLERISCQHIGLKIYRCMTLLADLAPDGVFLAGLCVRHLTLRRRSRQQISTCVSPCADAANACKQAAGLGYVTAYPTREWRSCFGQ